MFSNKLRRCFEEAPLDLEKFTWGGKEVLAGIILKQVKNVSRS